MVNAHAAFERTATDNNRRRNSRLAGLHFRGVERILVELQRTVEYATIDRDRLHAGRKLVVGIDSQRVGRRNTARRLRIDREVSAGRDLNRVLAVRRSDLVLSKIKRHFLFDNQLVIERDIGRDRYLTTSGNRSDQALGINHAGGSAEQRLRLHGRMDKIALARDINRRIGNELDSANYTLAFGRFSRVEKVHSPDATLVLRGDIRLDVQLDRRATPVFGDRSDENDLPACSRAVI